MDLTLKDVSAITGVGILFTTVIAAWVRNKMNLNILRRDFDKCKKSRDKCVGKFDEVEEKLEEIQKDQTDSFTAIKNDQTQSFNKLEIQQAMLQQKLDDYIRWAKNGGEKK